MPPLKKSRKNIKNSPKNSILIKKPVMSKSSNNSTKLTRPSVIPKSVECTTSMVPKAPEEDPASKTSSTCSSVAKEEEEEHLAKNKSPNANPPKSLSKSHSQIFTMERLSNIKIREPDAVKNAVVKEVRMWKTANSARVKVWSFKCTKWGLECINKFKSIVINAEEKDKLLLKAESVSNVRDKKFFKRQKQLRFQLKKVSPKISQSPFQEKVMSYPKQWLET